MRRIVPHQTGPAFAALAGFIILLLATTGAWANTRLAVIGTDADHDLVALLTARFSQSPGVEMVERDEIQRIAAEHQLQELASRGDFKQAGALLKSEGLIVLTRDTQSKQPVETARLIAVEPGVVIDTISFPVSDKVEADAAAIQARFGPLLEKIHMRPGKNAVAVSLLGLKFDVDSLQARAMEIQINRLVADRLIHEPGVFVLERWRMETLAWEKGLTAAPAPFWTGNYLLEGSIHQQGKTLTLSVRLKKADTTKVEIQLSGSVDNLNGIADEIAAKLKAELGTPGAVPLPWDKIAEAENFARLAEWAIANKLPGEAISAADSAVALGLSTPRVKALQIRAYAMFAYPDDLSVRNSEPFSSKFKEENLKLNLEALTEAVTLLTRFQKQEAGVPRPETFTLDHPEYLTPRLIMTSFRVLQRVHQTRVYLKRPAEAAALRAAVRQAASFYAPANALSGRLALTQDNIAFAPYWTETPEQTLAVYKAALDVPIAPVGKRGEMELMRWHWNAKPVRYPCLDDPQLPNTSTPWLVAWDAGQESQLPELWRNFVDELKRAPSIQAQIDGMMFEYNSTKTKMMLLKPIAEFLWNRRAEIFGPESRVTAVGLLDAIRVCSTAPQTPSFLPNILTYMLDARTETDILTWEAILPTNHKWTEEEARALEPRLTSFEQSLPSKPNNDEKRLLANLAFVHNSIWRQYPALAPQAAPRPGEIAVGHFWNLSKQLGRNDFDIREPQWINGKLWVAVGSRRGSGRICEVDPLSLNLVTFPWPDQQPSPASAGQASGWHSLEIAPEAIFLADAADVFRYNRASGQWMRIDLPPSLYKIRASTSGVYLAYPGSYYIPTDGCGLLKLGSDGDSYNVLISSRRTPPVSPLDGRAKNTPRGVFEDRKGNVYFWWWDIPDLTLSPGRRSESQVYRWSGEKKEWEKVFSSSRDIRLKDERPGALIMTRGVPPDGLGMHGFSQFEQIILLNPESGQFELLLENPEAEQHPLSQSPRWDFPPELCRILPNAVRFHEMAWYNGTLWVIAYDKKLGENRGSDYVLFAFVPGRKTAVQIPLRFTISEEDQEWSMRCVDPLDKPLLAPNGVFATAHGLVITAHISPGFWFLPYSEIPQLSQPAAPQ